MYGDPLAFSVIQHEHWYKELSPPWDGIAGIVGAIGRDNPDEAFMLGCMELLFVVLGLVATVATAIWLRPTWAVWMAGNWLMIVSTGFVMSVPRYSLVLFGIVVWAALIADRWRRRGVGASGSRPRWRWATSPGALAPASGPSDRAGQRNVPKEPRRSLR